MNTRSSSSREVIFFGNLHLKRYSKYDCNWRLFSLSIILLIIFRINRFPSNYLKMFSPFSEPKRDHNWITNVSLQLESWSASLLKCKKKLTRMLLSWTLWLRAARWKLKTSTLTLESVLISPTALLTAVINRQELMCFRCTRPVWWCLIKQGVCSWLM